MPAPPKSGFFIWCGYADYLLWKVFVKTMVESAFMWESCKHK